MNKKTEESVKQDGLPLRNDENVAVSHEAQPRQIQ